MTPMRLQSQQDLVAEGAERPSSARVKEFLDVIERDRMAARRSRWVGLGIGAVAASVAFLTAMGVVPMAAESVLLSASAVAAGLALSKG